MKDWLIDHAPESILGLIASVLGWWIQRKIARSDALEARVIALERDKATRGDIEALREHIDRSIASSSARVEMRTDEILLHLAARRGDR